MRRRRRFSGFAATCCMAAALSALPAARALALVDSIEAMVADADVVAVATVADVWRVTDPETPLKARAVLRLGDVIKGDASPGDLTVVVPSSFEGSFNQWKLLGGKKLVFLVRADRAAWHPPGKVYPWALRTHGWTLRENFAAGPRNLPAGVSLPDDVAPARGVVAFTVDLRPIYELDEAIAAARQSAARTVADATYVQFTMPEGCALREASPAFAHEILRIPVDDRAEAAAQRWAADPSYGEQTAAVLTHFDSDRNAAILTRLLDHPQRVASGRAGKMVTWSYPVRERAHRALERWGRATTPARLIGPRDFYRPLGASDLVTLAAFAALPVAGIVVFRRQRRRAAGVPSAVLPPAPRRFPTYAIVLAAAFMALVWLDRSSRTVVREVTASTGGSRLWLSAYGGGLQLVRIVAWPKEQPLSYGRFDLRDAPATLWNEADVFPADDRRFAGFRRLNGSMFGSARGATYPYHCVTIPVALVAALAGLLPAWHGVALLRDRSLRRSRAARGCCAACGYDLRGRDRQTTARCPECGTTASIAAVRSSRVSQYP